MAKPKQKVGAWDVLQSHPIAKSLDATTQLALLCEYADLYDDLQGMTLSEFIDNYFADEPGETKAETAAQDEGDEDEPKPGANGDGHTANAETRPASLIGLRVVYRYPGRNILSNEAGVTRDAGGAVSFVDVEDEPWSNVSREKVFPINPANHKEIHVSPREAKDINGWLAGTPAKSQPEGAVLRNLFIEFEDCPDRITFAVMNGKKPYVDRFVQLPDRGFEDDQKPTTRLFGEHCFRVRKVDYIVTVLTP